MSTMLRISDQELLRRRTALASEIRALGAEVFVGFSAATIQYLSGYHFVPNERPHALILNARGGSTLFVPLLKAEVATRQARCDAVERYPEYPDRRHPMACLADLLTQSSVLAEADGYAGEHGYRGPRLTDVLPGRRVTLAPFLVEQMRRVKSGEEAGLIRQAASWASKAQRYLQQEIRIGAQEHEISGRATGRASADLRAVLASADSLPAAPTRVFAGFGGQIGADGTAHHHQASLSPSVGDGDLLISQVGAFMGGYYADIERTMIAGHASAAARDLFDRGVELQAFAMTLVRPGVSCAEVDEQVRRRTRALGLADCWRHHTGHSVGLLVREAPYLDIGDDTVLEPGMVVTVEPGLYRDGVGGFRHSDCLLVTGHGADVLTEYPRDRQALTCS